MKQEYNLITLPQVQNKTFMQQINNTPLVIEQNNYATKIVNVYIFYDLDNWPKNLHRNFTLKDYLVRLTQ